MIPEGMIVEGMNERERKREINDLPTRMPGLVKRSRQRFDGTNGIRAGVNRSGVFWLLEFRFGSLKGVFFSNP